VTHFPHPVQVLAVAGNDARRFLATVLQGMQP